MNYITAVLRLKFFSTVGEEYDTMTTCVCTLSIYLSNVKVVFLPESFPLLHKSNSNSA